MALSGDILQMAVRQVDLAVTALIGWTNIHLGDVRVSAWRVRKAGAKLKALETLARRLILLMALEVDPPPPTKRADNETAEPREDEPADDSIEITEFPRARSATLALLPRVVSYDLTTDFSAFGSGSGRVSIKRFRNRIVALQKVIDAPEVHARRLARSLDKIRRAGEPKPLLEPSAVPSGLPAEIGLLHGGLAMELREALEGWDSS